MVAEHAVQWSLICQQLKRKNQDLNPRAELFFSPLLHLTFSHRISNLSVAILAKESHEVREITMVHREEFVRIITILTLCQHEI